MPVRTRQNLTMCVLASLGLAGLSGCYAYHTTAHNASPNEVQISVHKGKYERELSTVRLAPGSHVEWSGVTNGPVVLHVHHPGGAWQVVGVPRRIHTEVQVVQDGVVVEGLEGEEVTQEPAPETPETGEESPEVTPPDQSAEPMTDEPADEGEMIDLIEEDGTR